MANKSLSPVNSMFLPGLFAVVCYAAVQLGLTAEPGLCFPTVSGAPDPSATAPAGANSTTTTPTSTTPTSTTPTSTTTTPTSTTPTSTSTTPPENTPSSPSTNSGALQGSVATNEATAEAILQELEQTVVHLKDASWGAFTEAQRPDVVFIGGPNVVGSLVMPFQGGGMMPTGGYLPPRKKWIDFYALHVNYLGPVLKQELDSFKLPAGVSSDTVEEYAEYKKIGDRLPDLCEKMLLACQGPKYDNMTIAMAAGMLNEELKRYDKQRKKIYRDIREDFKHADKEAEEEKKAEKQQEKNNKEKQ